MRILIFGAGPLGSLLAVRLHQGGQQVTLLARGQRLAELRQYGIVLNNWTTKEEESVQVPLLDKLAPEDCYDLVLVVMRKNKALEALPTLAANYSPNFLFLMNNAAGPDALTDALGKDRVLTGFAAAAGYREEHKVVYINAEPERPAEIYLGEPSGEITPRLQLIASELAKGCYLKPKISEAMNAWSKYHVALLFPALATALYLCGNDNYRMARTRDAIVLAWRGIKEGYRVLRQLGVPIQPPAYNKFLWLPEPVMVAFLRKALNNPRMEVAMVRHAEVIRDEIQQLNSEFLQLAEKSGIFIPNIRFLIAQFNDKALALPDGSRSIKLDWTGLVLPILTLVMVGLFLGLVL
ncbi:MAG: 2-dehydropantoate 2-reductase N-terminal domain-containing protein [Pelolinea sp.]|nr:2-dehydropantoate 2-reductase N-terminal domain-containing protein [Pelolinea sp.]